MRLRDDEKAMLDGERGAARQFFTQNAEIAGLHSPARPAKILRNHVGDKTFSPKVVNQTSRGAVDVALFANVGDQVVVYPGANATAEL